MTGPQATPLSRRKRLVFSLVAFVGVPVLLLALIEGASSLLLSSERAADIIAESKRRNSWLEYHPQVGPVPRPNLNEPDMYGPGVFLRTNAQGFRGGREILSELPLGRIRLLCSGNSYTMGQEVSDSNTWCERLTALDQVLETVNLGVSGYGWDQAYLRYRHQGMLLKHDVHLFAFITEDIYRMRREKWRWPWQQPLLSVQDGELVARQAAPCGYCGNPLIAAVGLAASRLRTIQLLASWGQRLHIGRRVRRHAEVVELSRYVVQELSRGPALLLLIHLPVVQDYTGERTLFWRAYLHGIATMNGAAYIDLVEPLRRLSPDSISLLFLPADVDPGEHYTAAGHAWIANQLHAQLEGHLERARERRSGISRKSAETLRGCRLTSASESPSRADSVAPPGSLIP